MEINKEILDLAYNKKFTDFSKAVKQELHNKLNNHKVTKKYVSDFDKIQDMKKSFKQISDLNSEED